MSTYDANGGAARAAYALHRAMVGSGIDSRMVVGRKDTQDPTVAGVNGNRFRLNSELDRRISRLQRSPVKTWRSAARISTLTAAQINATPADVVNLHWVTDGLLSIEEIGRIEKPVVWSMYDMWPFAGTEHYCPDGPHARWREGYTKANRPADESGLDIDRWTFERKLRHWAQQSAGHTGFHMVPASTWLANATATSALMRDWQVTRIPHVVSDTEFAPMPKNEAQAALGIQQGRPTLLFLASAGIGDLRKGFDLLERALTQVRKHIPDLQLLVAGPANSDYQSPSGIDITWLGELHGNEALRTAYCSADVIVAPSREDNMPLTAMEAQTCGRPVVAFNIGGLPDIVSHQQTGYLATPFDTQELARGIIVALTNQEAWGRTARVRADQEWSPNVVVRRYVELYSTTRTN